jgi:hypothetical protein
MRAAIWLSESREVAMKIAETKELSKDSASRRWPLRVAGHQYHRGGTCCRDSMR